MVSQPALSISHHFCLSVLLLLFSEPLSRRRNQAKRRRYSNSPSLRGTSPTPPPPTHTSTPWLPSFERKFLRKLLRHNLYISLFLAPLTRSLLICSRYRLARNIATSFRSLSSSSDVGQDLDKEDVDILSLSLSRIRHLSIFETSTIITDHNLTGVGNYITIPTTYPTYICTHNLS